MSQGWTENLTGRLQMQYSLPILYSVFPKTRTRLCVSQRTIGLKSSVFLGAKGVSVSTNESVTFL